MVVFKDGVRRATRQPANGGAIDFRLRAEIREAFQSFVQRVGFEVRPGIIMTASFATDEQVCEVVIEPKRITESGIDVDKGIPAVVARQIVDEIVPVALRSPYTRGITMGNYTSVNLVNYEKVSIRTVLVGVGRPEADLGRKR